MEDIKYFHGRTVDDVRFTVAGVQDDNFVILGLSLCSKKDNFSKATGRKIAEGRLKEGIALVEYSKGIAIQRTNKSNYFNTEFVNQCKYFEQFTSDLIKFMIQDLILIIMKEMTINQYIDLFFKKYQDPTDRDNKELNTLLCKLTTLKDSLGGKQLINPEGELKELIDKYL